MKQKLLVQFLNSFFHLFNAILENYNIVDKKVYGTVGWHNEDDKQQFCWTYEEIENTSLLKIIMLCDFLVEYNLINGDSIRISEKKLLSKLIRSGWQESNAKKTIDLLCSIEIKMLDEFEETDSFFIHF